MIFNPDEGLAIPTFVMDRQNVERVSIFENLRILFSEKGHWDTHTKTCSRAFVYSTVTYYSSPWERTNEMEKSGWHGTQSTAMHFLSNIHST
jgi:hypothetical protein